MSRVEYVSITDTRVSVMKGWEVREGMFDVGVDILLDLRCGCGFGDVEDFVEVCFMGSGGVAS